MSKIYAVSVKKGGAGKTATTKNLAAAFSKLGKSVLVVDLDCQHYLSNLQGFEPDGKGTLTNMIVEYISGIEVNFEEYIRYHEEEKVSYIPCNETLAAVEGFLAQDGLGNKTLSNIFKNPLFEKFEYILFDCPTNVDGLLVSNAYKAADKLIIPVQAEPECYEGVPGTIQKMMLIKQNDNLPDIIEGFIVTMYRNTLTNRKVTEALKESYGDLVFTSYIPRLEEAVRPG